jgi:hypothetical protein
MADLPIYELKISEEIKDDAEVSFIAFVDSPAIKRDFLAFKESVKFEVVSEDQRIVTGPLMIPDQLIYRNSDKFGEHYVKFSAETIQAISIKFAKKGFHKNVNIMHEEDLQVDDVTMFGSFISNTAMGIKPMSAFADLPDGTWFGSFYVENQAVWDMIKSQKIRGFSVEGMFDYEKPASKEEEALKQIAKLLAAI